MAGNSTCPAPEHGASTTAAPTALTTDASTSVASGPADAEPRGAGALAELRPGLLYLLRRQLNDAALAEDLCNEAMRIVLERLAREPLDDPSRLAAYVAQTARNLAIAERRKSARRRTSTGEEEAIAGYADPADTDPASELQALARARAVRRVLEEMPTERDRQVLVRYYLRDEDKATLCHELGLSDEHFNRVLHRARERFRALLGRRYAERDLLGLLVA